MSSTYDYRFLSNYQLLILTSFQTLSMCQYDIESIINGNKIGYGIDGFDFCRFIMPKSFFKDQDNTHDQQIIEKWESFFKYSDGDLTFGVLSPFAILEIFATIEKQASGKDLFYSAHYHRHINKILGEVVNGFKTYDEVEDDHRIVIENLNEIMQKTVSARKILLDGNVFEKLSSLVDQRKLFNLEKFVNNPESDSTIANLLEGYQKANLYQAKDYLDKKRENYDSIYKDFYNFLDVYHYILFDNIGKVKNDPKLDLYISSSGLYSRNSWFLTKFGKFPNFLAKFPQDWAGRSSDAPAYLTKALNVFNYDFERIRDFFEEGKGLTRQILRCLNEIPEINNASENSAFRREIAKENPRIGVKDSISSKILNFQNEYLRILFPSLVEDLNPNQHTNAEIDLEALYEWILDPETRSNEYTKIKKEVKSNISKNRLQPVKWAAYSAPIGDFAADILESFGGNVV